MPFLMGEKRGVFFIITKKLTAAIEKITMVQGESLRRESMGLAAVKYSTTWLFLPWPRGSR